MTRSFLLLALLGCGDKLHHGIDAPPPDVSIDTVGPRPGDPPPNAVKLVVTRGAMPVIGVAVVFQNADSSLVHAGLTDERGLAWAEMANGGFVTAIERAGSGLDELTTFTAVQAGDALALDFASTGDRGEWPIQLGVTADSNASGHQAYSSCGGPFGVDPANPGDVLLVGCDGIADFVVVSRDADDNPLGAYYVADVTIPNPPPPPPTDAMPPVYPTVNVTGTYQSLFPSPISYSNVPAEITFLGVYHALANARGRIYETTTGADVTSGSANATLRMPVATAKVLTVTSTFGGGDTAQMIYESRDNAASYALDVGAALLPKYAGQTYDTATRTLSWTESGGGVQPDLVRARVHIYRDDIPSGRAWGWRIVAPRAATSVTYPQLPSFGFDFNAASTDIVGISELTLADVPGGYEAARAIGFTDLTSLVLGQAARMTVQIYSPLEL